MRLAVKTFEVQAQHRVNKYAVSTVQRAGKPQCICTSAHLCCTSLLPACAHVAHWSATLLLVEPGTITDMAMMDAPGLSPFALLSFTHCRHFDAFCVDEHAAHEAALSPAHSGGGEAASQADTHPSAVATRRQQAGSRVRATTISTCTSSMLSTSTGCSIAVSRQLPRFCCGQGVSSFFCYTDSTAALPLHC